MVLAQIKYERNTWKNNPGEQVVPNTNPGKVNIPEEQIISQKPSGSKSNILTVEQAFLNNDGRL